jgi:ribosome recycling factor
MRIPFKDADTKFHEALEHLTSQLSSLRVGRGSLQMIETIRADVYGQSMPLNQIAGVNMVDATLITVTPWDKNNVQPIVKAVQTANLGINPAVDGDTIKLPIPPLTEERRLEHIKMLHEQMESEKVIIRQIRKDLMSTIEEDKKAGVMGEDEMLRLEKEVQKKVDAANLEIEKIAKEKEKDLMQI